MRRYTKHELISQLAAEGKTKREAYSALRPLVESQTEPMVFKANPEKGSGLKRQPKAISEQLVELQNQIGRSYKILGRSKSADFEAEEISEDELTEQENEEENESTEIESAEENSEDETTADEDESSKPEAKGKRRIKDELLYFISRVREIRAECERRARLASPLDEIGMRPAEAAAKLIPAGIPADALLATLALHWTDESRDELRIPAFDFESLSRQILSDRGITEINGQPVHKMFGLALVNAENRIPTLLVGPKGTGKSKLCKQVAAYLSLDYAETPLSSGATRGDLLGRPTIAGLDSVIAAAALGKKDDLERIAESGGAGFIPAKFAMLYLNGGVFNFEEIDSADSSTLIVLNNALAGDELHNSADGRLYCRSADFVAMATANTFGLGANVTYTGREKLDAATLDRWNMGRIFMSLDEDVEMRILLGQV